MGGKSTSKRQRGPARPIAETFAAPIVLGGLFTTAFYGVIAALPPEWTFLRRYFCSHPLEYATAGLFFIAMGTLLLKFVRLRMERSEFRSPLTSDLIAGLDQNTFQHRLAEIAPARRSTWLVRRLADATAFVRSRGTASGLEDHLRYLGELAGDQLHRSYAFVRTITWAVPILGFLGTVIGITMAIANVTPEQLDTSLGTVTGGLAVAFDTTALALALSIVPGIQFVPCRTNRTGNCCPTLKNSACVICRSLFGASSRRSCRQQRPRSQHCSDSRPGDGHVRRTPDGHVGTAAG